MSAPALATVAVDAMGGDHAPRPEIEGAVAAARERLADVVLVGDEAVVRGHLAQLGVGSEVPGVRVQHASQVITMHDHPGQAVKSKKDASMRVAFDLVKRGEAHAVLSAGNSGAMLACGLLLMKRARGVDRPGIVTTFPTRSGGCALVDMGANVDCKPTSLAQFAVLGNVYARLVHKKARPRVGLLSNGVEEGKGTTLTQATHKLLAAAGEKDFDYLGYVEGRDIFFGGLDVVVTDGFTGNVVLKTVEGTSAAVLDLLKAEIMSSLRGRLGALMLAGVFKRLKQRIDYDEYGGAPLLGVDGVAVICHGGSSAKAVKNGVRVASELVRQGLTDAVAAAMERHAPIWKAAPADAAS